MLTRTIDNLTAFNNLMARPFADPPRSIPVKIYLPVSNVVLQAPVSPYTSDSKSLFSPLSSLYKILTTPDEQQTVGSALNLHMSKLFPSKRTCVLARPMIHGVEVPLKTPLLGLLAEAMYPDGFLHICLVMMT